MVNYLIARVVGVIPTVLLLLFFVVFLIRLLPGNAVDLLLSESGGRGGDADHKKVEQQLGLDTSIPEEFVNYSLGAIRGDLGHSLWSKQPVTDVIFSDLSVTMELTFFSLVIGVVSGVTIGVISAVFRDGPLDYVLRTTSILGLTIPNFALATMIVVFPTLWWGWSPPLTYTPVSHGLWAHFSQFFTPAIILGVGLSASLMRLTRTTMLEVLSQDYIRTARAKGLGSVPVIMRHALRNALLPVVSLFGLQIGALLSGAVLLEQVFGLPGIGQELLGAVRSRDYPMVQGITVVAGVFVIATNLLVDMSYGLIDPRLRKA